MVIELGVGDERFFSFDELKEIEEIYIYQDNGCFLEVNSNINLKYIKRLEISVKGRNLINVEFKNFNGESNAVIQLESGGEFHLYVSDFKI